MCSFTHAARCRKEMSVKVSGYCVNNRVLLALFAFKGLVILLFVFTLRDTHVIFLLY